MQTNTAQNINEWFEERRDLFVKNMFKEFYETFSVFIKIYEHYITAQNVSFEDVNGLVGKESEKGLLWQLKDGCHQLWRNSDPEKELNGRLLDWVMGSIFHEAMKLKENIYMYQYYGPLAESMKKQNGTGTVKFCGVECQRFMDRSYKEIQKQMETLGFMFGRACYLLRTMLPDQAQNSLLVRYLIENEDVADNLWSEPINDILAEMFDSPEQGYCTAAKSYFEGQWYEPALQAYTTAITINPECEEAEKNISKIQPILKEQKQLMPSA